jgi:NAD dependent epimerase/dehydratase family enzyme
MATVLITGGKGLIGYHLCKRLQEREYEISILSRSRSKEEPILTYIWDIDKFEIDKEAIANADYIIHLSGTSIGEKRWTTKRKQQIVESRIKSGYLKYEMTHLLNKLAIRDAKMYNELVNKTKIEPHPLFKQVEGVIEEWEIVGKN